MLRYCVLLKCEVTKKRHCMMQYVVILKCEVEIQDSAYFGTF